MIDARMGDSNQFDLVANNAALVREPILEVGSKDYGSTPGFRSLFPGLTYVGVDMSAGKGVDVTLDLTEEFQAVDQRAGGLRFNTVLCFSVLEHCRDPFRMSDNISRLLSAGGHVFVSVPFVWEVQHIRRNYWRFTADGIKLLFPDVEFDMHRSCVTTSEPGERSPIDPFMARVELSVSTALRRGQYGLPRSFLVRLARRLRMFPFIFRYRYLFPPVMINMIGTKREWCR